MKVTINIECTPEEARAFLGLPDVAPMQKAVMKKLQADMLARLDAMDPETLFRTWLPTGVKGWEQMQKAFWQQMTGKASEKTDETR